MSAMIDRERLHRWLGVAVGAFVTVGLVGALVVISLQDPVMIALIALVLPAAIYVSNWLIEAEGDA